MSSERSHYVTRRVFFKRIFLCSFLSNVFKMFKRRKNLNEKCKSSTGAIVNDDLTTGNWNRVDVGEQEWRDQP